MFIVESYPMAVIFCIVTMICWGSWANTQKIVQGRWRFELFYWDYALGIFLLALVGALTMGSTGTSGRGFIDDIQQADSGNIINALIGGVVFNLANILLTAAIANAGMAVAFPIGIGIALIIGVLINYLMHSKGDPYLLFIGVFLVTVAIVLNATAYKRYAGNVEKKNVTKWVVVSVVAGILMSTFYSFVASGMDLDNFVSPAAGKMTPYTAFVIFASGILVSNLLFVTYLMYNPLEGGPTDYKAYFKGNFGTHIIGIIGGSIWGLGNLFNLIAAGKAGPAISYGLGQGATMVAALWGVVIWKEFKGGDKTISLLIKWMMALFVTGLGLIIASGN
ncbi:GRP family sugar transporter [Dyadobacter sp. CY323]|uniref:GRP family sugar transporter n=1 Tax=Dyadobacter sp. CY323 TaxID=2907302 RepID=UPI001F2B84C7|nr:GRP family sugar transporter [Dyadobacter sp. CY323]MCE6989753.1 GRP family sugar transporter [Dyadobacter sp. CY323]